MRTASPLLPLALALVTGCDLIDRIRDEIENRGGSSTPAQPQNVPTTAPMPMPTQPPAQPGQPEALAPPPQGPSAPHAGHRTRKVTVAPGATASAAPSAIGVAEAPSTRSSASMAGFSLGR